LAVCGASTRRQGLFPLRRLPLSAETALLDSKTRGRLARDVEEARSALNWMHGEGRRMAAAPCEDVASKLKADTLQQATQQRMEEQAMICLKCDSAMVPQEALASLLNGALGQCRDRLQQCDGFRELTGFFTR
jgi:hypothetical protein